MIQLKSLRIKTYRESFPRDFLLKEVTQNFIGMQELIQHQLELLRLLAFLLFFMRNTEKQNTAEKLSLLIAKENEI